MKLRDIPSDENDKIPDGYTDADILEPIIINKPTVIPGKHTQLHPFAPACTIMHMALCAKLLLPLVIEPCSNSLSPPPAAATAFVSPFILATPQSCAECRARAYGAPPF